MKIGHFDASGLPLAEPSSHSLHTPVSLLFSVYAHGGCITAALLLCAIGGFVCTTYSAASCRFVLVEYSSERGNFDSLFSSQGAGTNGFEPIQTGAGLFSWLAPSESWDVGTCTGYIYSALEAISDRIFEAARFLVVIAIILGLGVFVWILSLACISLGPKQVYILAACQFLLVILVSLTFFILASGLCTSVGQDTTCSIDEGALVAIAAAVFWFVGCCITLVFMKSPEKERRERHEEIERRAQALAEKKRKRALRKRQEAEKRRELAIIEQEMMQQEQAMAYSSTPGTPETVESFSENDAPFEQVELNVVESLNRIQSLLDEDDEDEYI